MCNYFPDIYYFQMSVLLCYFLKIFFKNDFRFEKIGRKFTHGCKDS